MTFVGAVLGKEENADSSEDYIIFVADSMSSVFGEDERTKIDSSQKLYQIGNFLVSGAGLGSVIENTAHNLFDLNSKRPFSSLEQIVEAAAEFADKNGKSCDIIIGGDNSEGKLGIGFISPDKDQKVRYVDNWLGGSGGRFASAYVRLSHERGYLMFSGSLLETFCDLYDLGKIGATSPGANDKFQFGLVTKKVSVLYPSNENFFDHRNVNFLEQYLKSMLNKVISIIGLGKSEKRLDDANAIQDYSVLLSDFSRCFHEDLAEYNNSRHLYTMFAEASAGDRADQAEIEFAKQKRKMAKENFAKAIVAFSSNSIEAISNYIFDFHRRKEKLYEKLSPTTS